MSEGLSKFRSGSGEHHAVPVAQQKFDFRKVIFFLKNIFREKHYPLGWFILQNSVVGLIIQAGDAWNPREGNFFHQFKLKRSIGFQWRFQGFSFYNFPTAIGLEIHRGLDKFEKMVGTEGFRYGNKNRWYFTLLFGF